jgi:addiction module RelE/StbE family toxin
MKVRFNETALAELDRIFEHIAKDNPRAAAAIVDRVEQLTARIAEFPLMAYATDEPGVRVIPIGRFPYLIFYTVTDAEIIILHVRHAARLRP